MCEYFLTNMSLREKSKKKLKSEWNREKTITRKQTKTTTNCVAYFMEGITKKVQGTTWHEKKRNIYKNSFSLVEFFLIKKNC